MFKFLRSNAKFFYWVIAATFVGFIFLAWGMDAAGGRGAMQQSAAVGEVNGQEISARAYDQAVRNIQASYRRNAPDRPLTANQEAMARDQAWEQLVNDRLMADEIERLGLTVTDEEVLQIFRDSPPPEILQAFVGEDGQPDMEAYYAALGDPNSGIDWTQVENWVRQSVPRTKLVQMITAGVAVSEEEIRQLYVGQSGRAVAEYMGVAFTDLEVDEPAEGEVVAYYEDHPGEFHQGEKGLAKVVSWEIAPSPTDHDEVRALALEIKQAIESGEQTFEEAAAIFSEDGTADKGGDLGTFDRNRMVAPFTEVAFSLPVGEISEPVQTQFGFHLIEVLEQEMEDGEVARVHARHILLRVTPGEATRDAIFQRAEEFREQVTSASFLTLADQDTTCKVLSPRPFLEGRDVPGVSQSAAGSRFVFRAEPGEISPVFYTEDEVYIVMAEGIEPAGPRPLDEVRSQVVQAVKREKQRAEAQDRLSPAVGRVQMGEAMGDVAEELGLLHAVTDTISANSNVPDVGYATPFNMVALEAEPDQLVPEVETNRGLFALRVLWQEPFDAEEYAARRDQLRRVILQRRQNEVLQAWLDERRAEAEVVDHRDEAMLSI
ncbi:hypothetical protein GF314_11235 [bacterium]|nr:hypothetical protein [bacterium]